MPEFYEFPDNLNEAQVQNIARASCQIGLLRRGMSKGHFMCVMAALVQQWCFADVPSEATQESLARAFGKLLLEEMRSPTLPGLMEPDGS